MAYEEYDFDGRKGFIASLTPVFNKYDDWKLASPADYIDLDVCGACGGRGAVEDYGYRCERCHKAEEADKADKKRMDMEEKSEDVDFGEWDTTPVVENRHNLQTAEVPVITSLPAKGLEK